MAIRIRKYTEDGCGDAVCAAEHPAMDGDLYLHDGVHDALTRKFMADWKANGMIKMKDKQFNWEVK